jgi:hypothetical protein
MDYCKCRFNENKLKEVLSNNWIDWVLPYQLFKQLNQLREPTKLESMDLKSEINIFCKKQINEQEN